MKLWMIYGLSWLIAPSWLIGFLLGICLVKITNRKRTIGTLRMDRSDPNEAPYLFLELNRDGMREIEKRKIVSFKVDLKNYGARN